ncbi:MAG: hypothetical protein VX737_00910 [Pseudomonadota bacterium]|nr:hypothetical protein [Pseudomonadota bacterium]
MPSSEYIFKALNSDEANSLTLSKEFLERCNILLYSYTKLAQKRNQLKRIKKRNQYRNKNRVSVVERDIEVLSGEIKKIKRNNNHDYEEWKDHHESVTNVIKNYYEKRSKTIKSENNRKLTTVSERKRRRPGMFERDSESEKSGVGGNKKSKSLLEGIEKVSLNESYF